MNFGDAGKYRVVYADPPWTYSDKRQGRGGTPYDTLSLDQIKGMGPEIRFLSHPDSSLFLWVTWPHLQAGLDVIQAWGFEYRTLGFIWVKTNRVATDTLFWGCGQGTRSNSEVCLRGVRGKPGRISRGVHSVVLWEPEVIFRPVLEHSEKPPEVRDRIVELVGDVPRVELFARHVVPGWDYHGNEVLNGGPS